MFFQAQFMSLLSLKFSKVAHVFGDLSLILFTNLQRTYGPKIKSLHINVLAASLLTASLSLTFAAT